MNLDRVEAVVDGHSFMTKELRDLESGWLDDMVRVMKGEF